MIGFVEILVIGVTLGAAYALLALSINVIYSTSNILNFAQGELMMLGGMLGWLFYTNLGLPYPVSVLAVLAAGAIVGGLEYAAVIWPLARRTAPVISVIIATLGFGIVVRIATSVTMGRVQRFARPPLGQDAIEVAGVTVLPQNILIIGITAVVLVAVWAVYSRTTLGLVLRSAAFNPDGAQLMGVSVAVVTFATFAVGGSLAGLAGLIISPLSYASPWLGLEFAILGFAAAIIGGLGSWPGAVAGGILLGVTQAFALRYFSSQWGELLTLALLLAVLYARPTGLFAEWQAGAGKS